MKKFVKILFMLVIFTCFVTGCAISQDNIREYYDDIKGMSCTYSVSMSDDDYTIKYYTTGTKDDPHIKFDIQGNKNTQKQTYDLVDDGAISFSSAILQHQGTAMEKILNSYKVNKGCPSNLYLGEAKGGADSYTVELGTASEYNDSLYGRGFDMKLTQASQTVDNSNFTQYSTSVKNALKGTTDIIVVGYNKNTQQYYLKIYDATAKNTSDDSDSTTYKTITKDYAEIKLNGWTYLIRPDDFDKIYTLKNGDLVRPEKLALSTYQAAPNLSFITYGQDTNADVTTNSGDIVETEQGKEVEQVSAPSMAGDPYCDETISLNNFCDEPGVVKTMKFIGYIIIVAKILVPLIIIVMGSIDLGRAVVAQDDKEIQNGVQRLIRRTIAGIIIFFIPSIVALLTDLIFQNEEVQDQYFVCKYCLDYPGECVIPQSKAATCNLVNGISTSNQYKLNATYNPDSDELKGYTSGNDYSSSTKVEAYNQSVVAFAEYQYKKQLFKYVSPGDSGANKLRVATYNNAITPLKTDCNGFVAYVIKYATDKQIGKPATGSSQATSTATFFGPSGNSWGIRSSYTSYFEVVKAGTSWETVKKQAKPGDIIGSTGGSSTHVQIYIGNACVIGNSKRNGKQISKTCDENVPHNGQSGVKWTIIRIKKSAAEKLDIGKLY